MSAAKKMRLVQFEEGGNTRIGVELKENGDVIDLCKENSSIPRDMRSFIEGGSDVLSAAKK